MSVTKERLEEMENRILNADREELISMAEELNFWIGDEEELSDHELGCEVECGLSIAHDQLEIDADRCPEHELKTQNDIMNVLYFIKKEYVPKKEENKVKFNEAFGDFFKFARYANLPSLEGTYYYYNIVLAPKKFAIYISMLDMDQDLGTVNEYHQGTVYEKEVDLENQHDMPMIYTSFKGEYRFDAEW